MFKGFVETDIKGLLTRKLVSFPDFRGEFIKLNQNSTFKEQDMAISTKFVLRGFHYVIKYNRIFTPIYGRAYVVFVDMRDGENKYFSAPAAINSLSALVKTNIRTLGLSDLHR